MNKLEGLPKIYYINLDDRPDRREYMEDQFRWWEITDYERVNASRFRKEEWSDWCDMVHYPEFYPSHRHRSVAVSLSHFECLREWYETTNEDQVIILEDDTDFSNVENWNFTWKDVMDRLPFDWEAFQFCYNSVDYFRCNLHLKSHTSFNGPILLTRPYVKKLLDLYFKKGKYNFITKYFGSPFLGYPINNDKHCIRDVDNMIGHHGRVYQMPLVGQNVLLDDERRPAHLFCSASLKRFWAKEHDIDDLFSYNTDKDLSMTYKLNPGIRK